MARPEAPISCTRLWSHAKPDAERNLRTQRLLADIACMRAEIHHTTDPGKSAKQCEEDRPCACGVTFRRLRRQLWHPFRLRQILVFFLLAGAGLYMSPQSCDFPRVPRADRTG